MVKEPYIIIVIIIGQLIAEHENLIVNIIILFFYQFKLLSLTLLLKLFFQLYLATPISSPGCEFAFGIYPDSHECSTTYIKCAYGVPEQQPCARGLVYDERIHGCNWPDQLLETCNPEGIKKYIELIQ